MNTPRTNAGSNHAAAPQYLTFFVAGDEYAVEVLRVREVIEAVPATRVPSMPRVIRGVVNLRGNVVPLLDLGERIGVGPVAIGRRTCIVVLDAGGGDGLSTAGLLVDAVSRVVELPPDCVEPAPSFGTRARADLLGGMGLVGEKFVLVLDVDRVLALDDLRAPDGRGASP